MVLYSVDTVILTDVITKYISIYQSQASGYSLHQKIHGLYWICWLINNFVSQFCQNLFHYKDEAIDTRHSFIYEDGLLHIGFLNPLFIKQIIYKNFT